MRRAALAGLAALAAALALAASARAAAGLEVGMEDERLLLTSPATSPRMVAQWRELGVRSVRIHAHWWEIAPGRDVQRAPSGFNARDPRDRRYDWAALDHAVATAHAAGLRVLLTITGPGPLWASRKPSLRNPLWDPDPRAYGRFAAAVARRYGDVVDRYLIWNEPNQPGWLQPQNACARRRCTPVAPHIYRALVRAAVPAIRAADPRAEIVLGELAPIGEPPRNFRSPIAPRPFLQALACVDAAYRPVRSGRCAHFRPVEANAFGYHPHPKLLAPDQVNPDRDEAQFADLGRLFTWLDRLTARKRIRVTGGGRLPLYLTEFGYQTSPPDPAAGVALRRQSDYLQTAAFLAWRRPRVRSLIFYQWEDEPVERFGSGTKAYGRWQSGLRFTDGRAKPALSTFAAPFVVEQTPGRAGALFWGQVRAPGERTVTLLVRPSGSTRFREAGTAATDAAGYWSKRLRASPGASYRFRWTPLPTADEPHPSDRLSAVARVAGTKVRALRAGAATSAR